MILKLPTFMNKYRTQNKSSFAAGALRVKANLPQKSLSLHNVEMQMDNNKVFDLQNKATVMVHNGHNGTIRWQISKSIKDIIHFLR